MYIASYKLYTLTMGRVVKLSKTYSLAMLKVYVNKF